MASPRASPARLQYSKGVTVYAQGIVNSYVEIKMPVQLQVTDNYKNTGLTFTYLLKYNSNLYLPVPEKPAVL